MVILSLLLYISRPEAFSQKTEVEENFKVKEINR